MTIRLNYTELFNRLFAGVLITGFSALTILFIMAVSGDQNIKLLEEALAREESFIQEERISVEESFKSYIDSLPIPEPLVIEETEEEIVAVYAEQAVETVEVVEIAKGSANVEYEVWLLAKGIHGEASICNREEKYKVGTVIMNRVASSEYPNTVEGVLSQPRQYSSYQDNRWYTEEPSAEELEIARDIYLNGTRVFGPEVIFQSKTCEGECVDKTQWHEYGVKAKKE